MPTLLPIVLFNFKNGGRISAGNYDFTSLQHAFSYLEVPPALIILCEAKEWGYWGRTPLLKAAQTISRTLGVPYQIELGHIDRGDFGPAILFNPNVLQLDYWGDKHSSVADDQRNLARFIVWNTDTKLEVLPEHWDFRSGRARMPYAERIGGYGTKNIPVLVAGDLNETASGLHLPQMDWNSASAKMRKQKGRQRSDGNWEPHTDAVDLLVGAWDARYEWGHPQAQRMDSLGFYLVAEIAAATGTLPRDAFQFTTRGSHLLIDMLLVNNAWLTRGGIIPETYRVIGNDIPDWPSDHYMVCVTLYL
ncbi:MAG TPA: hypothetical protein VFT59_01630 [Candidatus Saccharimonadales bacterium]|nr:hypothetical protein [Candidatus Saccharimonadales bacterium]